MILRDLTQNANHAQLQNLEWEGDLLYFRGLFQWVEIPASEKYLGQKFAIGGWVFLRDRVRGGWNDRLNHGRGMTFFGNGYHTSSFSLNALNQHEVLFQQSAWAVRGGSPDGVSICIRRGQRIDILSNGQDDSLGTANMADQVPVGKWHHILYTFANPAPMEGMKGWLSLQDSTHFGGAGMAKVYVNGELVHSSERIHFNPRMAPFLVGSDANWWLQSITSGSLDGSVRDLVFFDRALKADEVKFLYQQTRPKSKPLIFDKGTVMLNERPVAVNDLDRVFKYQAWEVLQQLKTLERDELQSFIPWLKTQKNALAIRLLLEFGEIEYVKRLIPEYLSTFKDNDLSDKERADALLALLACKDIGGNRVLDFVLAELGNLSPQILKVEDYFRNAVIFATYEMDPDNETLKTLVSLPSGRFFSQGDEMRDARAENNNPRAYTPEAVYDGIIYRCGTGVPFKGVEPVSAEEFEQIAQELESQYPQIRRWAEGKRLARVIIYTIDTQGREEKIFPLGRHFIFDETDAKLAGWSIAFDKDGYAHLTGGMHNAPVESDFMPGSWESWGLSRELKNDHYPTMLYWVSKTPRDVTSFDFVGQRNNERNIPLALGMNYMNFVQDRNQDLYLYGRIHVQGLQSWGMYRYDTPSKKWTGLGGFAPDVKTQYPIWSDRFITMAADWLALPSIRWQHNHPKNTVLAWSLQPHFYNFIRGWGMRWDPDNRLHVQVPMFSLNANNRTLNMPLYAYSDDGGKTFSNASGKQLELPLTANPGPGNACILTWENLKHWNLWVTLLDRAGVKSALEIY